MNKNEYERIYNHLKANDADFSEIYQVDDLVVIPINWGDWKHSHLFLVHLMEEIGYKHIDEILTETDGSDTYSSEHTFCKME
jgi:hypothetical protein